MRKPFNKDYVDVSYMQMQKWMSIDTGAFRCKCKGTDGTFDYWDVWHKITGEWWHFKIRKGWGYRWTAAEYRQLSW